MDRHMDRYIRTERQRQKKRDKYMYMHKYITGMDIKCG